MSDEKKVGEANAGFTPTTLTSKSGRRHLDEDSRRAVIKMVADMGADEQAGRQIEAGIRRCNLYLSATPPFDCGHPFEVFAWEGDSAVCLWCESVRGAEVRGAERERERILTLFTSGEFCKMPDHPKKCMCDVVESAIRDSAPGPHGEE